MDFAAWVETLARQGTPLGIVALMIWFAYKMLWPFFVKQLEDAQAARKVEAEKFMEALAKRDALAKQTADQIVQSLQTLREEVMRNKG